MFGIMLRATAEVGPQAVWMLKFFAAVNGALIIYLGIALVATLRAHDEKQGQLRYQLFHQLVVMLLRLWGRK